MNLSKKTQLLFLSVLLVAATAGIIVWSTLQNHASESIDIDMFNPVQPALIGSAACSSFTLCVVTGAQNNSSGLPDATLLVGHPDHWKSFRFQRHNPMPIGTELVSCVRDGSCVVSGVADSTSPSKLSVIVVAKAGKGVKTEALSLPDPRTVHDATVYESICTPRGVCWLEIQANRSSGLLSETDSYVVRIVGSTIFAPIKIGDSSDSLVSGISCSETSSCTVYGQRRATPSSQFSYFVQTERNQIWGFVQPLYAPFLQAEKSNINGISCTAAGSCYLVGVQIKNTHSIGFSLFETSGHVTSSNVHFGIRSGQTDSEPSVISCPSSTVCVSAGSYWLGNGNSQPFVETMQFGQWRTLSDLSVKGISTENGISCKNDHQCYLVGTTVSNSGRSNPFIESIVLRASGRPRMVALDLPGLAGSTVDGISCNTRSCVVYGNSTIDGRGKYIAILRNV